jgi:hypothetical protein
MAPTSIHVSLKIVSTSVIQEMEFLVQKELFHNVVTSIFSPLHLYDYLNPMEGGQVETFRVL